MHNGYAGVTTRILRRDERMMASDAPELPLVIEAVILLIFTFCEQFLNNTPYKSKPISRVYGAGCCVF